MRKSNLITIMLLLAATLFISSCIGDGDDTTINTAAQKQYQSQMSGTYNGKAYFIQSSAAKANDSTTTIVWRLSSDSIITVANFPVSSYAKDINDSTSNISELKALKTALKSAPNQPVKLLYGVPSTSYVTSTYINFVVNPYSISFDLTYDGATHNIIIPFQWNYCLGTYTISTGYASLVMLASGIYIDKTSYSTYFTSTYTYLFASSKY